MRTEDQFRVLTFLSETHRTEARHRSAREWRVVFSTLSFYVLVSSAILSCKIQSMTWVMKWIMVLPLFVLVAGIAISYLYKLHSGSHKNKRTAEMSEQKLAQFIQSDSLLLFNQQGKKRCLWAFYWQMVIIIVFAVAAFLAVLFHSCNVINAAA